MALGPVVSGAGLAEDEVVGAEDLAVRAGSDAVHGSGFEIHEDGAWDEATTAGFVVVDIHALKLEFVVALVTASGVDPVLRAYYFPELCSDLIPALASLNVKDFSHFLSLLLKVSLKSLCAFVVGNGGERNGDFFIGGR